MTREYDAHSRPNSPEFREHYDAIFRKAKKERKERSDERQKPEPEHRPATMPKELLSV